MILRERLCKLSSKPLANSGMMISRYWTRTQVRTPLPSHWVGWVALRVVPARAVALTPNRRSAIAKKAARARWSKG
jgi:hypothetical protein